MGPLGKYFVTEQVVSNCALDLELVGPTLGKVVLAAIYEPHAISFVALQCVEYSGDGQVETLGDLRV